MAKPKGKYTHRIAKGYVGVPELQERLGKSATTIWKMTLDGRLPKPLKDGKRNVWDELEIRRWIQNGKFLRKR